MYTFQPGLRAMPNVSTSLRTKVEHLPRAVKRCSASGGGNLSLGLRAAFDWSRVARARILKHGDEETPQKERPPERRGATRSMKSTETPPTLGKYAERRLRAYDAKPCRTPILLTHTPTRCRVIPVAGIKLGIGRRRCVASDAEQRTEGVAACQHTRAGRDAKRLTSDATMRTDEAVPPAHLFEVFGAGGIAREEPLKLRQRPRKRQPRVLVDVHENQRGRFHTRSPLSGNRVQGIAPIASGFRPYSQTNTTPWGVYASTGQAWMLSTLTGPTLSQSSTAIQGFSAKP